MAQMTNRNQKNHRNHINHSFGFTLAEMMIVMAITAILGTVGVRTYFTERDRFEFNNALTKTMQLVKAVRTYATTSFPIYAGGENIIPKGGYGIHIQLDKDPGESTLTIFANLGELDPQEDDGLNTFDPDIDQILETYTLPKQISFRYFIFKKNGQEEEIMWKEDKDKPEDTGPTAFEATLIFKPPMGELSIVDDDNALEQLSLQFSNPATDSAGKKKCQRVIINQVKAFPELMYESICS